MSALDRALAAPVLARDRMRPDVGALVVIALLVAVTAALAAVLPRLLEASTDAALRAAVVGAPSAARDLRFERVGSIAAGPEDPLGLVVAEGRALHADLPDPVRRITDEPVPLADTVEHLVIDAPVATTQLRLRIQPGVDRLVDHVEGRPPNGVVERIVLEDRLDAAGVPYEAIVTEVSISTRTAEALGIAVGDRLLLQPAPDENLIGRVGRQSLGYALVDVVGRFEIRDPADPAWFDDASLGEPSVEALSFDSYVHHGVVLASPDAYPSLVAPQPGSSEVDPSFPIRYRWHLHVDPERLDAGDLDALRASLARLRATHPLVTADPEALGLRTNLDGIVAGYGARRTTTEAALLVAAVGPAIAAVGALALVAALLARRRLGTTAVVRSRGASASQILAARLVEALLVVVPAALVGLAFAAMLVPLRDGSLSIASAGLVVLVSVVALVSAAWPSARARAGAPPARLTLRPSARRLVLDGFVLAIALAAAASLLGRGLGAGAGGTPDPFLAAAPALVAVAGALLAVRVLPPLVALLARAAARRRDLVPVLAARTAARRPTGSSIPLLVVIVATAMAVFASLTLASVEAGQDRATWVDVGADVRVTAIGGQRIPPALRDATVPGVRATAEARIGPARIRGSEIRPVAVTLVAVDTAALGELLAGTPIDGALPPGLAGPFDRPGLGTEPDPIPVLASSGLLGRRGFEVGASFGIEGRSGPSVLRIVGTLDELPGLPLDERSIVVPLAALRATEQGPELQATHLLVAAVPGREAAVDDEYRELTRPYRTILHLDHRSDLVAGLHASGLVAALRGGFGVALAVSLAYVGLAIAAGIVLATAARTTELAILRTLGVAHGGLSSLILLEQLPLVAVAVLVGLALGVGIVALVLPALGLDVFTGSVVTGIGGAVEPVAVTLVLDGPRIVAFAVLPMLVVVGVVVAVGWLAGRRELARSVRLGEA